MKFILLLLVVSSFFSSAQAAEYCKTDECYRLSQDMKSLMNVSTDPCDDFYEYACGNYLPEYSGELNRLLANDFEELANIVENFKPNISNEKVALAVLRKCVNDESNLDTFMSQFWDETDDLTKLIIEVTKVKADSQGIFINDILPYGVNAAKRFTIILTFDKKNAYTTLYPLKEVEPSVEFMNLTEYFYQLLPEKDRHYGALDDIVYVDESFFRVIEILEATPKSQIKEVLHEAWKNSLKEHFVENRDFGECLQKSVVKLFPGTSSLFFLGKLVKQENIDRAVMLFKQLETEANEMITESKWLDESTKSALLEKLNSVKSSIGIPDNLRNQTFMDAMYGRVLEHDIEKQSYLELLRNVKIMNSEETYLQISRNTEMTFQASAFQPNANYMPAIHRITVAPFFIKFPFVNENLPDWSILASFSYVLGHELGHMFDPHHFYVNEHFEPIEMNEKTKEDYDSRTKCLIEKYSEYKFPGTDIMLDGKRTVGENFADQFGIQLAYRLFKKLHPNTLEQLPDLPENSTLDKQFFHRMAYVWCGKDWNLEMIQRYNWIQDPHSPGRFRVNGIASNSPQFAASFGCAESKAMNPDKKCPLF